MGLFNSLTKLIVSTVSLPAAIIETIVSDDTKNTDNIVDGVNDVVDDII